MYFSGPLGEGKGWRGMERVAFERAGLPLSTLSTDVPIST